jgi:hypothetical protein
VRETVDSLHAVTSPDLSTFSTPDLFGLYRSTLAELKSRGVIRTMNAPAGDYAEHLVRLAFDGTLAPNSQKSWDVKTPDGERLQVKARVLAVPLRSKAYRQLGILRTFDFDRLVIVLLGEIDYRVVRAVTVPRKLVAATAVRQDYANGYLFFATDEVLNHAEAVDVTERLAAASAA